MKKKQKLANPNQDIPLGLKLKKDWSKYKTLYFLFIPVLVYYIVFQYGSMFGLIIAFENYKPRLGFFKSPFVGLTHFKNFINDYYFKRTLMNTIRISVTNLIFTFPCPILLAIFISELRSKTYSKAVQTITYIPHFVSVVVVTSILMDLTGRNGAITQFLAKFGFEPVTMLNEPKYFLPLYIISNIWQNIGWNSIVYLAALLAIDAQLYEAARIDGAGKLRQLWSITLPSLLPTIIIMLILQIGKMFNVGYEKIILMYNPMTYEVADVINSYVYREGLLNLNYSYAAAVGMFNSIVSFILVWTTNKISNKLTGSGLW
ncbi:sugar ABC transporter permease [Bullifex porci]|uniref:Sugar ABC transporter permease n=1 Tax=Bullifex porci TaxID=2606638 RepID=A0A7X2TQS6_9SPIO|nr:ABC transporter permease subunit [Bullifex porci]MDD7256308.1 ABC transporter permease subunit [Bullifex porci]MDD7589424.1 ABC transporter permease subunit [Bullifex porci]MDY2740799.1 ABC transporter permease subunit [Bullifex porci]MSU05420.1 sugar ABC transporter permease [Bullifex porci]